MWRSKQSFITFPESFLANSTRCTGRKTPCLHRSRGQLQTAQYVPEVDGAARRPWGRLRIVGRCDSRFGTLPAAGCPHGQYVADAGAPVASPERLAGGRGGDGGVVRVRPGRSGSLRLCTVLRRNLQGTLARPALGEGAVVGLRLGLCSFKGGCFANSGIMRHRAAKQHVEAVSRPDLFVCCLQVAGTGP